MQIHKDLRTILKPIKKVRGVTTEVFKGKKHIKVLHGYRGRGTVWIAASTPSDVNAINKMAKDAKAALARLGLPTEQIPKISIGFTTVDMGHSSNYNDELGLLWRQLDHLEETGEELSQHPANDTSEKLLTG